MATISLSLPSDGQTIDAADVNTPLNTIAAVINGNLDDNNIVSGAAINGTKLLDSSITNAKMATAVKPVTLLDETTFDFVASGGVWTADSVGVNLNASMTAMIIYINGRRISIDAVTARPFTLNVDTYIDVLDNADGTGLLVYTTAATNAASPALAANSVRIGIIQAAATITAATKVNQGQEDRVFPIASSTPYAVTDSLGNLICPRDSGRKLLGYRQILTDFTTTNTPTITDVTGISVPFIAPGNRKVIVTLVIPVLYSSAIAATIVRAYARESSTQLADFYWTMPGSQYAMTAIATGTTTPSAGLHTYVGSISQSAAGTIHADGSTATVVYLKVELW